MTKYFNLFDLKQKVDYKTEILSRKKKLAWKYLTVGVSGGVFLPKRKLNESGLSDEDDDVAFGSEDGASSLDLKRSIGYDVGLMLQYQINSSFSLVTSAHYQRINYAAEDGLLVTQNRAPEGYELSSIEEADLLAVNSDTTLIEYNSVEVKQRMMDYRLGVNYSFRSNKKWRPYIGLSVSAISVRQKSLWGQIVIDNNNNSSSYAEELANKEKVAEASSDQTTFRFNGIVPTAGFHLSLTSKLNWQMEGWYRQGFNKKKDQLNGQYGLRTGFSYQF